MSEDLKSKKFFVTIRGLIGTIEMPVWATSLDEALDKADQEYAEAGFTVDRVRPEVKHYEH